MDVFTYIRVGFVNQVVAVQQVVGSAKYAPKQDLRSSAAATGAPSRSSQDFDTGDSSSSQFILTLTTAGVVPPARLEMPLVKRPCFTMERLPTN